MIAEDIVAILDLSAGADIQTDGSIELKGITSCSGLRTTKHDTNLLTQLVDEDTRRIGFCDGRSELTQCLTHQTGLQTY